MATTTLSPQAWKNPYKFSAYRTAALNSNNGDLIFPFDTETFDTNSNFDITTNKGRYTAPVAGFYFLSAVVSLTSDNVRSIIGIVKGGSTEILVGNDLIPGDVDVGLTVSGLVQLSAGDYVEVRIYTVSAQAFTVGLSKCTFQGFLVSQT